MRKEALYNNLQQGIGLVKLHFPLLTALIVETRVSLDERIDTACVFPSGRILVSPYFIADLSPIEIAYLIAHEIFHLYYQTFERGEDFQERKLINVAHDLIINGELTNILGISPPKGGLDWMEFMPVLEQAYWDDYLDTEVKPIGDYSLEELLALLKEYREHRKEILKLFQKMNRKKNKTAPPTPPTTTPAREPSPWDELDKLGFPRTEPEAPPADSDELPPPTAEQEERLRKLQEKRDLLDELLADDVRTPEEELALFPHETLAEVLKRIQEVMDGIRTSAAVKVAIDKGNLIGKVLELAKGHGLEAGGQSWETELLRGDYHTPWELALQKWFDESAPRTRSWAHASRRQGDRNDLALPGHAREGWTLHIVLDTSGSMEDEIPRMLGALEHFARGADVTQVHILQVDTEVTDDDIIELDDLAHFEASGGGGSDMTPAMLRLAQDPEVQHVLVLTDGEVDYPPNVPYDVVWAVPPEYSDFTPTYGKVIALERNNNTL